MRLHSGRSIDQATDGFNSHTPGKGATDRSPAHVRDEAFQFTHPGKGATDGQQSKGKAHRVSIHAPWEGCDLLGAVIPSYQVAFQFTHPGKGATRES